VNKQNAVKENNGNVQDLPRGWEDSTNASSYLEPYGEDLGVYPKNHPKYAQHVKHLESGKYLPAYVPDLDHEETKNAKELLDYHEHQNGQYVDDKVGAGYRTLLDQDEEEPTYHVFHSDPDTKRVVHVGTYKVDGNRAVGTTHTLYAGKDGDIKNAVASMHGHSNAVKQHLNDYNEFNSDLGDHRSFDNNPDHYDLFHDSYHHWLQHGKPLKTNDADFEWQPKDEEPVEVPKENELGGFGHIKDKEFRDWAAKNPDSSAAKPVPKKPNLRVVKSESVVFSKNGQWSLV
jgi:hypothetical protein